MKPSLLVTLAGAAILTAASNSAFAQAQTINGQLVVNGNTFIGSLATPQSLVVKGGTFIGDPSKKQVLNLDGDALLHDNVTIDDNLTVSQGTTLSGNAQIGTTTRASDFTVYGNSFLNKGLTVKGGLFIGAPASKQELNLDGDAFLHDNVTIDDNLIVSQGTTLSGNSQIGTTTRASDFTVYGNSFLNKSLVVKGGFYVGAPESKQPLNLDGDAFLNDNLTVGQGTTLSGNAQVGTSTKSAQFQVFGNTYIGSAQTKQLLNVDGNTLLHDDLVVDGVAKIGGLTNIGAGLTDKYKLWVQKGVVSEDFAIAPTSEWADYVFQDNYKLPSLKEVGDFISTNKHLQDIPSQSEVEVNGYSMRQVNVQLLRKVEELTLYAIDQDKKMEQLSAELAQLKAAIAELKK